MNATYRNPEVLPSWFSNVSTYIPFDRDQLVMLLIASNELMLGFDTYLAHVMSGTIVFREWIPIIFGPVAGGMLFAAGLLSLKWPRPARMLASVALLSSFFVGVLGAYFHFQFAYHGGAPAGYRLTIPELIWAPPVLGPLTFSLVGWLGFSAIWVEDPPESGRLRLFDLFTVQLPYSKTRAYLMIVSLAVLVAAISSVLDHARHGFDYFWMWCSAGVGVFGALVSFFLAFLKTPNSMDLFVYFAAMIGLILLGPIGLGYHVAANLTAGREVVLERFLRGAPVLAPLLFSNVGVMGLVVLVNPREQSAYFESSSSVSR